MDYDQTIEKAQIGMVRLVAYSNTDGDERLEMVAESSTLDCLFREVFAIEEINLDNTRRERLAFGIFDDQGKAIWVQFPQWSPNPWEGDRIWQTK